MAETLSLRRIAWRGTFVALATCVAFTQLLPLGTGAGGLPGPDIIVLLAFAWVARRPDYAPLLLIAPVMLLADVLFMRPPGLWAAFAVLGTEFLRNREHGLRELPFPVEWGIVAAILLAMTLGNAFVLLLVGADQPTLGLTLIKLIVTIATYPLIVGFTVFVLRLRRVAPGEVDERGRRL
jgi:rod shape-determining protein MreD